MIAKLEKTVVHVKLISNVVNVYHVLVLAVLTVKVALQSVNKDSVYAVNELIINFFV